MMMFADLSHRLQIFLSCRYGTMILYGFPLAGIHNLCARSAFTLERVSIKVLPGSSTVISPSVNVGPGIAWQCWVIRRTRWFKHVYIVFVRFSSKWKTQYWNTVIVVMPWRQDCEFQDLGHPLVRKTLCSDLVRPGWGALVVSSYTYKIFRKWLHVFLEVF